jgi:hypothetical protein
MSVIASKYLALNVNRIAAGSDTLLKATNCINDDGQLRFRNGQDLVSINADKPFISEFPSTVDDFKPIKIWFYNNQLWVYFRASGSYDGIGYYNFASNQWRANKLPLNYTTGELPQIAESDGRLVLLSKNGAQVFPKLSEDRIVGSFQQTLQTTPSKCGTMKALPIDSFSLTDTSGTYNQNWLNPFARVAYTSVWKKTNENGIDSLGATGGRTVVINGSTSRAVTLRIQIPKELVDEYSAYPLEAAKYTLQIYRTYVSLVDGSGTAPDPGANFYLVMEIRPTAAEITSGSLNFLDIQSDFTLQDPLYTNEFELGPTQEKERPPYSTAVALFQSCLWYGNTVGLWRNFFNIQAVMDGGASPTKNGLRLNDVVIAGDWAFEAVSAAPTNWQFQLDTTTGVANQINRILNSTDSLIRQFNRNANSTRFNLHSVRGADDFVGKMYLEEQSVGAAGQIEPEYAPYIGLCRANGYTGQAPCPIAPVPKISDAVGNGYIITRVEAVGSGFRVKFTINTNPYGGGAPDFAINDRVNLVKVNGNQSSWPLFSGANGKLVRVVSITNMGAGYYEIEFDQVVSSLVVAYQIGFGVYATYNLLGAMHAVYDESTGGVSNAIGERDAKPHRVYYTPPHEPESTPPLQYFDVGFSDKKIIAIRQLSDSLFIFKEDGLYRVQGYYPDFYVSLFDENVILLGADLITQMAGNLYALTTKGVYEISEQGVTRISFPVQNEIDYIVAKNQANVYKNGFLSCNPSDQRLYVWLPGEDAIKPNKCFVWDGAGWTTRDDQANYACYGLRFNQTDQMSLYTAKNIAGMWVTKERRSMTMLDFCDEALRPVSVTIVGSHQVELYFNSTASMPGLGASFEPFFEGAVIIWDNNSNSRAIVTKSTWSSGNRFLLELNFPDQNNSWTTGDWDSDFNKYRIYLPFTKEIQYGINADSDPSTRQHWTELMLFTSQPLFTEIDLGFATDVNPTQTYLNGELDGFLAGLYSSKNVNQWKIKRDDPDIAEKTFKRVIPVSHQRGSQIRISLRHRVAMEFLSLMGYSIRTQKGGLNIERNNNV